MPNLLRLDPNSRSINEQIPASEPLYLPRFPSIPVEQSKHITPMAAFDLSSHPWNRRIIACENFPFSRHSQNLNGAFFLYIPRAESNTYGIISLWQPPVIGLNVPVAQITSHQRI